MIEFSGKVLDELPVDAKPEAVLWASRGSFDGVKVEKSPGDNKRWRAFFDLHSQGKEPVELRLYLKNAEKTLSETWIYQYLPFESSPRPLQGI